RRELAADLAREVEADLAGCPTCRTILAREEAVAELGHALPRSPAPPTLVRQIRALDARRPGITGWLGRPWVAAAIAAVVVAGGVSPGAPPAGGPAGALGHAH